MLHVLEWPWEEPPSPRLEDLPVEQGAGLAEYRRYREKMGLMRLEALVPESMRLSQRPVTRLSNGKPHVQILEAAQEEGSDLIVIGVHGRNPFDMMLFGSTTNQVVRRAMCAILTLRRWDLRCANRLPPVVQRTVCSLSSSRRTLSRARCRIASGSGTEAACRHSPTVSRKPVTTAAQGVQVWQCRSMT